MALAHVVCSGLDRLPISAKSMELAVFVLPPAMFRYRYSF